MANQNYTPPPRQANIIELKSVTTLSGAALTDARDHLERIKTGAAALNWALDNLRTQIEILSEMLDPLPVPSEPERRP